MSRIFTYSLCESFIDRLVDHIMRQYVSHATEIPGVSPGVVDLSRLAVVFGGRRPALFVNRELAQRIKRSFYPPRFFTIDDFVCYIVEKNDAKTLAQDLDQCYLIYQLAKERTPQILRGRATFARFLPWAREILNFIDHLDLEGVGDESLRHIQANAAIGYDVPADINSLLEHMIVLRQAYHQRLKAQGLYSRGYQYWQASQWIGKTSLKEFDQILFCNFFYFHQTQEDIVKALYNRGQATLIFQGDQRQWPALARIATHLRFSVQEQEAISAPRFQSHLYRVFDRHSQAATAREILKTIADPTQTVIVLPNADSLVPLVSEIAGLVEEFNVSMGYPLRRSSLYSLCASLFKAQLSKRNHRYYSKDYLKTLRHPFVKNLHLSATIPVSVTRILIHKIEEILTGKTPTAISGSLFIALDEILGSDDLYGLTLEMTERLGIKVTRSELVSALQQIHEFLFEAWEDLHNFQEFAECLGRFLDVLGEKSLMKTYPLNLHIATRMYEIKEELETARFRKEPFGQEELFKIFDGKITRELIALRGSPLKGLQILGLFETRSLDFEHVIVLDVNEGTLPQLNINEPLIPREVMVGLNLDRLELEEEIQRYQLMRLLSSAKDVHLIYQEGKDKEKSRFIEELIWKEEKDQRKLDVMAVTQVSFGLKVSAHKKIILKTPAVIERLKDMRYSASSVNAYLRNPLEFYYNYVLGLKSKEDLLDEPQARQIGTFLHELLEEGFRPFLNKRPKIDSAFRHRFIKIFEDKFEATLIKSMKADAFMLKTVMTERLNRFLDNEESNPERQVEEILHLESRFEDIIPLSCGKIHFTYVIDRVDRLSDGTRLIVDYKTGAIDQMPKATCAMTGIELTRESIAENIRSFQIPLYFYYLNRTFSDQPINAALYNLRTLKFTKFLDNGVTCPREEINKNFLKALDFVISEILNPDIHFESDQDVMTTAGTRR